MEFKKFDLNYVISVMGAKVHVPAIFGFDVKTDLECHHHTHFELHYELSGRTAYELNSQETVEITAGQWLLLNRDVYHEETNLEKSSGYWFLFGIESAAQDSPLLVLNSLPWFMKFDPETGRLLQQILAESEHRHVGYEEVQRALITTLLVHIIRQYQGMDERIEETGITNMNVSDRPTIDAFFNQVFKGITTGMSPNDLARWLNVTPRQLNRIIHDKYDCTFTQLLNEERVKYAEYQLERTQLPLSRIAEQCGVSETYLIRIFRAYRGITPKQYRESKKKDV